MSIKLYNGYRAVFPGGFDLLRWQDDLGRLRDDLTDEAQKKHRHEFDRRVVYALDRDTLGLTRTHPEKSPIGQANKSFLADYEGIANGLKNPLLDTEITLCWKAVDHQTLLCILYAEMQGCTNRISKQLGLEDYHHQNQSDPPDGCTWEEMQARGKVWEKALGNWDYPPDARFHSFQLCEPPRYPPYLFDVSRYPPYHRNFSLEERARSIAFDLLFEAVREEARDDSLMSVLSEVHSETKEGGVFYDRLKALTQDVQSKLIVDPTWDDYRRKPSRTNRATSS